ncbi:MAG: fused MFS/spermidine synthase [Verrucomicrobiota bacterium]|nr:fused MFS/spermidine synthase [Verrucomicrobiota bacterium]
MHVAIVSVILFLSGCSALLFQTLWLRLSGLAFGNSIWSAALILSSFMAGLAVGSAIAASLTLRRLRPLRLYAGLEMIVAIFGCTLVFALPHLGTWLRPVFQAFWEHQQLLNGLRFTLSFLILLVPTTAMGLSLPVLLEDAALQRKEFSRSLSLLYGANTLGAMGGALLGEFYLIGAFGLFGTAATAAGISCAAALVAVIVSGPEMAVTSRQRLTSAALLPWRLLIISAGTGAILLALEVIWFRFLRLYVVSTNVSFAIMLAVVLAGLGLGSFLSSLVTDRRRWLPILLLLSASATLLSYLAFRIPNNPPNLPTFTRAFALQTAFLSCALMLPVAVLSGALLPTIIASVQVQLPGRMQSAGWTILFNTIGAALGPLLAGFLLLPWLGFQTSLILCALAYAALACLTSQKPRLAFISFGALFLLILAFFPFHRDEVHLARARLPYEADGSVLVKKVEGVAETFQLLRRDLYGQPYYYRLITNSYSMSGTLPRSQRYMRLFAYLPLALRPESEDALLVGYGVGVTADAFTHAPRLKHLHIVDISKEVFDLAALYTGPGYADPLHDPRVATFIQDGRFYLQASPKQYDIITGEPPPLKTAGTVNLYTEQFFSLLRDRLKEGGIASFWLPLYQLTADDTKAILRAFLDVFPNASLWASSDLEWIMIGIKPPLSIANEQLTTELWTNPATQVDLRRIGLELPAQMPALFVMDAKEIGQLTANTEPLDDFHPKRLSDAAADSQSAYEFGLRYLDSSGAQERFASSTLMQELWPNESSAKLAPFFLVRETRYRSELSGSNWLAELDYYLRGTQLRAPVLAVQNSDEFRLVLAERALTAAQPPSPGERHDLIAGALASRDLSGAIRLLETERERGFGNGNDFFLLIYLYCLNGSVENAEALAATRSGVLEKDWFVTWLWGDLQAEFGFRPPP